MCECSESCAATQASEKAARRCVRCRERCVGVWGGALECGVVLTNQKCCLKRDQDSLWSAERSLTAIQPLDARKQNTNGRSCLERAAPLPARPRSGFQASSSEGVLALSRRSRVVRREQHAGGRIVIFARSGATALVRCCARADDARWSDAIAPRFWWRLVAHQTSRRVHHKG